MSLICRCRRRLRSSEDTFPIIIYFFVIPLADDFLATVVLDFNFFDFGQDNVVHFLLTHPFIYAKSSSYVCLTFHVNELVPPCQEATNKDNHILMPNC